MEFEKVLNHLVFQKTKIQTAELLLCFPSLHSHQKGIWFFLLLHPNHMPAFVAAAYWLQQFFALSAGSLSLCQILIVNLYQALSYSAKEHFWLPEHVNYSHSMQWVSKENTKSKKFQTHTFIDVILLFDIFLYCEHN